MTPKMNKLQLEDQEYELFKDKYGYEITERQIYIGIYYYSCPIFLLIGTAGNICAAIILQRMISKVLSTCSYVFVVVLCDLIVLYIRAGNIWYYYLTGEDVRQNAVHSSNVLCKLYPFVDGLMLHMTIWTMAAMAIEIAAASLRPYLLVRIYKLKRATAAILLIIVLLICLNAHCFWSYALVKEDKDMYSASSSETHICTNAKQGHHDSEEFRRVTWPVLEMVLADLVPLLTVFSCIVIVFTKLRRDQLAPSDSDPWNNYPFDVQGAKDLRQTFAIMCILYLVFITSKFGYDIFKFLIDSMNTMQKKYPLPFTAKSKLANCICDIILFAFVSCKCLLFLAVSSRFRLEFRRLMRCYRWSDSDPNNQNPSRHQRERYRYKNVNGVQPENARPRCNNSMDITPSPLSNPNDSPSMKQFTTTTV